MPARQSKNSFKKYVLQQSPEQCWPWLGCKSASGHGRFIAEGSHWYAHRLAYEAAYGQIPAYGSGVEIMHLCEKADCCNPRHLQLGTRKENSKMAGSSGRLSRKGECNGNAKLTDEQVAAVLADSRPSRAVAKDYKVGKSQILNIRRGDQRKVL